MMTLAAPCISDRGGIERPSMGAAWVSAYTVAVASAAGGLLEDQARARMLPPPHDPSLLPIHSPYLRFPCPSFPVSFSRSLSLSLSLRPPRILFPAVCPFRFARHNFALPSPELCTFICHSPHPHCPLAAYPPRPNSCAPDLEFGGPTPTLMIWTPGFDVVDPNNFAPVPPPFMAPTSDFFRVAPSKLCFLTNHWYPRPQPLVCWPPASGLLLPKHWFPGRQH